MHLTQEEYDIAAKLKDEGNEFFKSGDYKGALKSYSQVFRYIGMNGDVSLPGLGDVDKQSDQAVKGIASSLRVKTFQNIMQVYNKLGNDEKIVEKAEKILELTGRISEDDPLCKQKAKAYFFRAQVYRKRTDFELCEEDLNNARDLVP